MNRNLRRLYAKQNGVPMPKGTQQSHVATHRVVYKEVIKKSNAGVKYKHLVPVLEPITKSIKERFFA